MIPYTIQNTRPTAPGFDNRICMSTKRAELTKPTNTVLVSEKVDFKRPRLDQLKQSTMAFFLIDHF